MLKSSFITESKVSFIILSCILEGIKGGTVNVCTNIGVGMDGRCRVDDKFQCKHNPLETVKTETKWLFAETLDHL